MPNTIGINGGTPQKPTRSAPIYTGRWSSGLWTNRSPLRDANTSRIAEKYYGPSGDALIAGLNVEVTNRLTLARRPGNSVYDSNSWTNVDNFYEFRLFNSSTEQIKVIVDQANALYSLFGGVKTLIWTKSSGAGESFPQAVGNELYFGNGVDNKKWLQTLQVWAANEVWNTSSNQPFLETFLIDPNGNIQQLTAAALSVTNVSITSNVLTVIFTSGQVTSTGITTGNKITFSGLTTNTFLNGQTVTVTGTGTNTITAAFTHSNVSSSDTGHAVMLSGGTPTSGGTMPTWSTTVPSSSNNFQGGITYDGTAQWTNRGLPTENWGLVAPTSAPTVSIGSSRSAWHASTFYSLTGVIIDSNGNVQQVTTAGTSGSTQPVWATTPGQTTTDNTVVWTLVNTAANLTWQAHTQYGPVNITNFSITSNVVTFTAANNLKSGQVVLIAGLTTGTYLNGQYLTVISTGLSSTQFEANFTHANVGSTADTGTATPSPLLVNNASGTNCLFELSKITTPYLTGTTTEYFYNSTSNGGVDIGWSGSVGAPINVFRSPVGQPAAGFPTSTGTVQSVNWSTTGGESGSGGHVFVNNLNGAGEVVGTTDLGHNNGEWMIVGTLHIRVPGQYSFNIEHDDGAFIGFGSGPGGVPQKISGIVINTPGTQTVYQGYTIVAGNNNSGYHPSDPFVMNFQVAGDYPFEIDYSNWKDQGVMILTCNGAQVCPTPDESGTTQPVWPTWTTSFAPAYPTVKEAANQYVWQNLGPVVDDSWQANISFTLPDTTIIDNNGNTEAPYRAGVTGTTQPTFQTGLNQLTNDNPNLIWINQGQASAPAPGTVSAFNGGFQYGIALVNTLDDTVSNLSTLTAATGNFVGASGVSLAAGSGLNVNTIDPQADYVAIFRTTDGGATPFLIPGTGNSIYTISLHDYLVNGYTDTATDEQLNNLISAPTTGQNTPPIAGAVNLTYHLNRIFFSVGNTVYWTSGPDTPVGNGVNGVGPNNFDVFPSLVKRIVPTAIGAIVFTVSDIFLIQGSGTTSSPIQAGQPYLQGIGLLSYNALAVNGSVIGFFSTDNQFIILDPSSGVSYAGFPIGDQFRQNNSQPGTAWNAANVYVTYHTSGEDQAWYVSDGTNGWYRLMATPAPESGLTWSPFANIVGGCKAVQSIETSPGVHKLLLGPTGTGPILNRDLSTFQDNGNSYIAWAVIGSMVLAQPGQVAAVHFLATDSTKAGTPLSLGILIDEALPYFTGSFEALKEWESDPPTLPESQSILGQRFYFSALPDSAAVCRHMQARVNWVAENAPSELLSLCVFGNYYQES